MIVYFAFTVERSKLSSLTSLKKVKGYHYKVHSLQSMHKIPSFQLIHGPLERFSIKQLQL